MLIIPGVLASSFPRVSRSFESIATATGTGSNQVITINNIPTTYQHLQVRIMGRTVQSVASNTLLMQINNVTTTSYDRHFLRGTGAAVSASGTANTDFLSVGLLAGNGIGSNTQGVAIIDIHDYASTTKNKTIRSFTGLDTNGSDGEIYLHSGLLRSTSAITRLDFNIWPTQFGTSTTIALYGIKGA